MVIARFEEISPPISNKWKAWEVQGKEGRKIGTFSEILCFSQSVLHWELVIFIIKISLYQDIIMAENHKCSLIEYRWIFIPGPHIMTTNKAKKMKVARKNVRVRIGCKAFILFEFYGNGMLVDFMGRFTNFFGSVFSLLCCCTFYKEVIFSLPI